jgi:hypothetical protein
MPQRAARRSKNWKFTDAAAAMGAFWERARLAEAERIEGLSRTLIASATTVVIVPAVPQVASPAAH